MLNTKTMSNKRQTAVDWLVEQYTQGNYSWEAYEKAKEMEKEQIVDAIVQHQIKHHDLWSEKGILQAVKQAEQYYTETYNTTQP
jgi:leucyl aminopeptidase